MFVRPLFSMEANVEIKAETDVDANMEHNRPARPARPAVLTNFATTQQIPFTLSRTPGIQPIPVGSTQKRLVFKANAALIVPSSTLRSAEPGHSPSGASQRQARQQRHQE